MADTVHNIYLLGSKMNDGESIILIGRIAMNPLTFATFEEAKANFAEAYKLLLAPSFTPTVPPGKEELEYHQGFMRLMTFYPVILEVDKESHLEVIRKWRKKKLPVFQTKMKVYPDMDYWHCPMRSGFLKAYEVLDIVHDIETTPFIGPNGKMVVRVNRIEHASPDSPGQQPKPLSDKEARKILKRRGYL